MIVAPRARISRLRRIANEEAQMQRRTKLVAGVLAAAGLMIGASGTALAVGQVTDPVPVVQDPTPAHPKVSDPVPVIQDPTPAHARFSDPVPVSRIHK